MQPLVAPCSPTQPHAAPRSPLQPPVVALYPYSPTSYSPVLFIVCSKTSATVQPCKGTRVQGYEGARVQGLEGARVRGYEGAEGLTVVETRKQIYPWHLLVFCLDDRGFSLLLSCLMRPHGGLPPYTPLRCLPPTAHATLDTLKTVHYGHWAVQSPDSHCGQRRTTT